MDEVGYQANAVARALRIKRSQALGLIISDITNPFFSAVARGVEDVAQERGYTLILCNSDEDPDKEEAYLRILGAGRVDGLVLAPSGTDHNYLMRMHRSHFPLVLLDRAIPHLPISSVHVDGERAAHEAVTHLIGLGHSRIGMVSGLGSITSSAERIRGYRRAMIEADLLVDERLIVSGDSRLEGGEVATAHLLDLRPPPSALFVANNMMTLGAVAAVHDRGLQIPADIALVGFDDFPWADVFRPRLSTVAQPTYELGRRGAELLVERIADPLAAPERIMLPGHLVIRESCGATSEVFRSGQPQPSR
jgi:LacI family transcriptional regulator